MIGLIDPKQISRDKRLTLFDISDYDKLLYRIKELSNLIILPNIWTEVDNLMNKSVGVLKNRYIEVCKKLSFEIKENYLKSHLGFASPYIFNLGLTDSLLLDWIKNHDCTLISIDSKLCDIARAHNLNVIDMVKEKNDEIFKKN